MTTAKSQKEGKSVQFIRKLNTMMCARMTTWVVTQEEERFLRLFRKIAALHRGEGDNVDKNFGVFSWSVTEGMLNLLPNMIAENGVYKNPSIITETRVDQSSLQAQFGQSAKPVPMPVKTFSEAYEFIKKDSHKRVFILKDVHNLLEKSGANYAAVLRSIKDIIYHVRINDGYLIFLSPSARTPIDIENDVQIYDMPRPDDIDISELLDNALSDIADIKPDIKLDVNYTNSKGKLIKSKHPDADNIRERIVMNLRGLTESEISQILAYNCVKNKGLEESAINEIKDAKRQVIEKSGSLKFISVPKSVKVGGHDNFKKYIEERGLYLNKRIRDTYSLVAPKGTLMVGVSGAGKSLLAKYVGYQWNVPLIRLNMDSVFGKYLGESEDNLRVALSIAEANAPCVLWIDELEKALGGTGTSGDSGTGLRILGKILTWMQEREEMVFMFATANNVAKLPPELQRAGRFDAKFWADLPSINECKDIFEIKSKENGFELKDAEYVSLGRRAFEKQMTGAEIEHAVIQGVYAAAVQASKEDTTVPVTEALVREAVEEIHSHASSHQAELLKDRTKALEDYTFTSTETRRRVEQEIKGVVTSV